MVLFNQMKLSNEILKKELRKNYEKCRTFR